MTNYLDMYNPSGFDPFAAEGGNYYPYMEGGKMSGATYLPSGRRPRGSADWGTKGKRVYTNVSAAKAYRYAHPTPGMLKNWARFAAYSRKRAAERRRNSTSSRSLKGKKKSTGAKKKLPFNPYRGSKQRVLTAADFAAIRG